MHIEIEQKYDVDEAFALPELVLEGLTTRKPKVQRLAATYFDTPDLRLQAARVTLRRRTGGTDSGWHLKLPLAGDRLEVHRPLGRGALAVPADLAGLVRLHVRSQPLGPVAKISTRRTVTEVLDAQGRVLAEIADDVVTSETLGETTTLDSWHEVEIELVEGDRELLEQLGALVVGAGARPSESGSKVARALGARMPAPVVPDAEVVATGPAATTKKKGKKAPVLTTGDVVLAYVREQVQEILLRDPEVRLDLEDAIHRMRVATRRLRSTFTTFETLFDEGATAPLSAELKWLAGELGRARDAEVLRGLLLGWVADLPAELVLGPVHNRIDIDLRHDYRQAHDRVIAELDGERYLALVEALETFATTPALTDAAAEPAAAPLHHLVGKVVKKVGRRVEAAAAAEGPERDLHLHETRKAVKKLRYATEAVAPVFGGDAKKLRKALTALQEALGGHQDAVVAREALREIGVRAHLSGENGFTFGLLSGLHTPTPEAHTVDVNVLSSDVHHLAKAWAALA